MGGGRAGEGGGRASEGGQLHEAGVGNYTKQACREAWRKPPWTQRVLGRPRRG